MTKTNDMPYIPHRQLTQPTWLKLFSRENAAAGLMQLLLFHLGQIRKPQPLGPAPGLKGRDRNKRDPKTGLKLKELHLRGRL